MTTLTDTQTPVSVRSHRWFARVWSWVEDAVDETVADVKDSLLVDLPEHIVEIGPGLGSNFKRYAPGTKVVAFERNTFMHAGLIETAAHHGVDIDVRSSGAGAMDVADQSQDVVVSSFTLCSVGDPVDVVAEIKRVLKPGGRFVFVEHIAAEPNTLLARVQTVLRRPWAALFDRCDLMANTHEAIERAGFAELTADIQGFGPKADPSRRVVFGTATR